MYKIFFKPLLFMLNPERAYSLVIILLRIIGRLPGVSSLLRMRYSIESRTLQREVFGLKFKNPIGLAAGVDVNGDIIDQVESLGFGFVEIGGITPKPQVGNPKPRLFRLSEDRAIINRMGQPNKGLKYVVNNLRNRKRGDIIIGCNIARNIYTQASDVPKEYLQNFRSLYQYVDYFTVNVISSMSATDGVVFNEEALRQVIEPLFEFRRGQSEYRPILIKISPDLTDNQIDQVTDIMIDTPLDGIVAVSGTLHRENLKSSAVTLSRVGSGRLGGAPLRERAIEIVKRVHDRSKGTYPIIGVGGVMSAEDARAMLEAGASLVQIHSGMFYEGPRLVHNICKSLL